VGDAQAVLAHVLDMLGPWIDEGHVLASLHHVGAGIPADSACANDCYFLAHAFLFVFSLVFLDIEASPSAGLFTMAERMRRPIAAMTSGARVSYIRQNGLYLSGLALNAAGASVRRIS